MPRWRADQNHFTVGVAYGESNIKVNLPKPVVEILGNPERITFFIEGKNVRISGRGCIQNRRRS